MHCDESKDNIDENVAEVIEEDIIVKLNDNKSVTFIA